MEAHPPAHDPTPAAHPAAAVLPPVAAGKPLYRRLAVGLLLAFHVLLANAATWNKSPTFDETAHIGNGFSFWATGDYRMSPDSILPQRWMTLPLYLAGYKAPPTDGEIWWKADVWSYGRALLYELGNDHWSLLHTARFTNSLWNVGTGLIVYWWAAKLFGVAGGFLALITYLFNPTVLAHGSSITTDAGAAFAFTAATAALWNVLHTVSPLTVTLSCLAVGAAFITKFSSVLLIPIALMITLVRILGRKPLVVCGFGRSKQITIAWQQVAIIAGLVALHVVAAWIIIWAVFGFRYEMMLNAVAGRDVPFHTGTWDDAVKRAKAPLFAGDPDRNVAVLSLLETVRANHLLPEAYLTVFVGSLGTTAIRSSFLNGRYGVMGFPEFFPCCFLYKTPVAVFVLMFAALAAHITRRIRQINVEQQAGWRLLWSGFYATSPLWSLLFVYWSISILRGINIGIRHILPTFPATFILIGAAGAWLYGILRPWNRAPAVDPDDEERFARIPPAMSRAGRYVTSALAAWMVIEVLLAFPNYLAYFNRASGGINQGYTHLVDSSLDWGQEIPALKRWLDDNVYGRSNPPRVYIALMGSTPPSPYGLHGSWLNSYFDISSLEPNKQVATEVMLEPGVYCISATMLQCVYNSTGFGFGCPGPWRADYEQNYQTLFRAMATYIQKTQQGDQAGLDATLAALKMPNWNVVAKMYEVARFGRLCASLRHRTPDAVINGVFMIYRISKSDLEKALLGPPSEMFPTPAKPLDNVPY